MDIGSGSIMHNHFDNDGNLERTAMDKMPGWMKTAMKTKLLRLVGAAVLLSSSGGVALADAVGFTSSAGSVVPGATLTVDIVGTGFTELAGGVIDIGFDNTHLQINSVSIDPHFDFQPDGGAPAVGNGWADVGFDTFANAPAVGVFTIATITLTALVEGVSALVIQDSSEFFSVTEQLDPILTPGTISSVPVPAAAWLFGSSLLGLIVVARKRNSFH